MAFFKIVDVRRVERVGLRSVIKVTVLVYDKDREEIDKRIVNLQKQQDELSAYQWVVKAFTTGIKTWCVVPGYIDGLGYTQIFDGE